MRPIITLLFIASLFCTSCNEKNNLKELDKATTAESILENISEAVIPDFILKFDEVGGVGDSLTDNHDAFKTAIETIAEKGGGSLIVPPGNYLINGPIHLTSNLNLHLDEGVRLFFGSNPDDYLPVVKTSWEGTFLYNYSPFIYARDCSNISITGKGTIDGEASETWGTWHTKQKADQLLSREMNHNGTPIEERVFGSGHYLRPHLIQFFDCKNIKVEGVSIEDSPFWCLHLLRCENVIVRGVRYNAFNRNNDGIDPEYTRNVLIENVHFNNSDDNVAIKAGRDDEGRASKVGSENIVVRNCHFKGLHALVIGSEMSAGVKNVFVYDCDYAGYLKRGIYLKSNPDRGGFIRNVFLKNIDFGDVEDCIYITSYYHNEGEGHSTEIKDIYFEDITCKSASGTGIVIQGFPEKKISDVYFSNITIGSAVNAISMTDTENIVFSNLLIGELATTPSTAQ
ncbi:MAG: glycoside hydrolase family 28 protein [Prolixibacteraceae bacterium]|nr:glycoside hydrolase family 28 protein [Prolixibacteraceae bacterium]